jgi:hypothetical protein
MGCECRFANSNWFSYHRVGTEKVARKLLISTILKGGTSWHPLKRRLYVLFAATAIIIVV